MFDPRTVSESEKICIRILADHFVKGTLAIHGEKALNSLMADSLEIDETTFGVMMRIMEVYGVVSIRATIADAKNTISVRSILPGSIQRVREIDEHEKKADEGKDIVGQVNEKIRSNRVLASILIVFFVLMAVATFINQTISIFQNLGWMAKP